MNKMLITMVEYGFTEMIIWDTTGILMDIPPGYVNIAIEHGHRNRDNEFSSENL